MTRPDPGLASDHLLDVRSRTIQISLDDDADLLGKLVVQTREQLHRPLDVCAAFHVDPDKTADLPRRLQDRAGIGQRGLVAEVQTEHGQLDRDVGLELMRLQFPHGMLECRDRRRGFLRRRHVLAKLVQGGGDAALMEFDDFGESFGE